MLTNPKKLKFESVSDLADFISKGIPPFKKDFDNFIVQVEVPSALPVRSSDEVYIPGDIVPADQRQVLAEAFKRVYENRRRHMWYGIGALSILALIFGGVQMKKYHERKKETEINDSFHDEWYDDYEDCDCE